jgi:two-component system cell cycle sensor histidine kinase/response regulator CckA
MTMPGLTGDKLAQKLLAIKPDLPIIICTGYSERINEKNYEKLGVKGLLKKPVLKNDLAEMVRKTLDEV